MTPEGLGPSSALGARQSVGFGTSEARAQGLEFRARVVVGVRGFPRFGTGFLGTVSSGLRAEGLWGFSLAHGSRDVLRILRNALTQRRVRVSALKDNGILFVTVIRSEFLNCYVCMGAFLRQQHTTCSHWPLLLTRSVKSSQHNLFSTCFI